MSNATDRGSPERDHAIGRIEAARQDLVALSHRIHAHPEVGFEEVRAAAWLGEALDGAGYRVETGVAGLPTAFIATCGSGPLTVAICAEYDALPGIGHACGHNLIAAAAVGAALGLAAVADAAGVTVQVMGTPAEEAGGGKVIMLEHGAFAGVDAAVMVHPSPRDCLRPPMLAAARLDARYAGHAAHASAHPEDGRNAADAITVAQVALGLLRQHVPPGDRFHGIVRDGGRAPNIVPDRTEYALHVRAPDVTALERLRAQVDACLEAGAVATGCTLEVALEGPAYADLRSDLRLSGLFDANARSRGRVMAGTGDVRFAASTDMGNVSQVIPSLHPLLSFDTGGVANHEAAFAAACASASADDLVVEGAVLMALTLIDLAASPSPVIIAP